MQAQSITENIIKIVKGNVYNNLMGLFSAFANNARKLDETYEAKVLKKIGYAKKRMVAHGFSDGSGLAQKLVKSMLKLKPKERAKLDKLEKDE
jgi:fido (protein-threonine AMPylation protein)